MGSQTLIQVLFLLFAALGFIGAILRLNYLRTLYEKGNLSKNIFRFRIFLVSIIGAAMGGILVSGAAIKLLGPSVSEPGIETNDLVTGVGIFLGSTFLLLIILTSVFGRITAPGKKPSSSP